MEGVDSYEYLSVMIREAVSYTHLDVYKRQAGGLRERKLKTVE